MGISNCENHHGNTGDALDLIQKIIVKLTEKYSHKPLEQQRILRHLQSKWRRVAAQQQRMLHWIALFRNMVAEQQYNVRGKS